MLGLPLIELIRDIIDSNQFPDSSFEARHLERIGSFELVGGKIQFQITRHPHLFGRTTVGMPSTAYIPIRYTFELDPTKKEVSLFKETHGDPVVDYDALASNEVDAVFGFMNYEGTLETLKTEDEVVDFAIAEFNEMEWFSNMDDALADLNNPEFEDRFRAKLNEALAACFQREMIWHWRT